MVLNFQQHNNYTYTVHVVWVQNNYEYIVWIVTLAGAKASITAIAKSGSKRGN